MKSNQSIVCSFVIFFSFFLFCFAWIHTCVLISKKCKIKTLRTNYISIVNQNEDKTDETKTTENNNEKCGCGVTANNEVCFANHAFFCPHFHCCSLIVIYINWSVHNALPHKIWATFMSSEKELGIFPARWCVCLNFNTAYRENKNCCLKIILPKKILRRNKFHQIGIFLLLEINHRIYIKV